MTEICCTEKMQKIAIEVQPNGFDLLHKVQLKHWILSRLALGLVVGAI